MLINKIIMRLVKLIVSYDMVYQYMRYNGHEFTIQVNFYGCVCVGFGSNGFVIKVQSFPMNGHYRMNIISGVGHLRSDSIMLLVLCTVVVQYSRHCYCTTGLS
jgi:hypothetical protein